MAGWPSTSSRCFQRVRGWSFARVSDASAVRRILPVNNKQRSLIAKPPGAERIEFSVPVRRLRPKQTKAAISTCSTGLKR